MLPLALSAFLALLAIGAVGHALSIAVRRRRHELAVLRALGDDPAADADGGGHPGERARRDRAGVRGAARARARPDHLAAVAGFTPLAYHPPLAVWALLLIGPLALLAANVLAAWPGGGRRGCGPDRSCVPR